MVIEQEGGFAGILEDILERGIHNEAAEQVAEAFETAGRRVRRDRG